MNETPSQEIFDEMKQIATEIWESCDNIDLDEKLFQINDLPNVEDNAMIMFRMFDRPNQIKFFEKVKSQEVLDYIKNNR